MSSEVLTKEEIERRYDGEWVLIGDPELDESLHVLRGVVLWHDRNRGELYEKALELRPAHCAVLFLGRLPEDIVL